MSLTFLKLLPLHSLSFHPLGMHIWFRINKPFAVIHRLVNKTIFLDPRLYTTLHGDDSAPDRTCTSNQISYYVTFTVFDYEEPHVIGRLIHDHDPQPDPPFPIIVPTDRRAGHLIAFICRILRTWFSQLHPNSSISSSPGAMRSWIDFLSLLFNLRVYILFFFQIIFHTFGLFLLKFSSFWSEPFLL